MLTLLLATACLPLSRQLTSSLQVLTPPTDAQFRGISMVSKLVCWTSGSKGTFARTVDGKTWTSSQVSGMETTQFRSIVAFDADHATMLAIGPGDQSRIVHTDDGGRNWNTQFVNTDPKAFYDSIAFWDKRHGIGFSDPVDGKIPIVVTDDAGQHWFHPHDLEMPPAIEGEGAFSASGTCIVLHGSRDAWIATGGSKVSRVFHSSDRGRSWTVAETPVVAGIETAGIFGLRFRDAKHGIAIGGDYKQPEKRSDSLAFTSDGGKTWTLKADAPGAPSGLRECASYIDANTLVVIGPEGGDVSRDGGTTWRQIPNLPKGLHTCAFQGPTGWSTGDHGTIVKLDLR